MFNIISTSWKRIACSRQIQNLWHLALRCWRSNLNRRKILLSFLVCSLVKCCKLADGMLPAKHIQEIPKLKRRLSPAVKNNRSRVHKFRKWNQQFIWIVRIELKLRERHDHCSLGVASNEQTNDEKKKSLDFVCNYNYVLNNLRMKHASGNGPQMSASEKSPKICLQLTFSFVHFTLELVWGPTTRSLFIPTFFFILLQFWLPFFPFVD